MASPRFTIFIPSYNGGDFLRQSVASVRAQSFADFELALLDDGSTDGSLEWVRSLGDARIKLYPSQHLGIVGNWRRTLDVPKGEFMTILGQDDLLDANYLAVMDALIRRFPDAGLFHSHFRFIDRGGKVMRACGPLPERETAAGYITALYGRDRDTYGTGYLFSSDRYDRVGGIPPFEKLLFADDALWISLMQGSYKATATEECFSCRIYTSSTGASAPWQSWLAGMNSYIPFLQAVAAQDAEFAAALENPGHDYFLNYARSLYNLAVVQATKRNQSVDPTAMNLIREALAKIAPEKVAELDAFVHTRPARLRAFINANVLARWAYNLFILAKHREWRGKRL